MAVKRGNRTKRKNANRAKSKRDAVKRKRVRRRISLRKGKRACSRTPVGTQGGRRCTPRSPRSVIRW